MIKKIKCVLL